MELGNDKQKSTEDILIRLWAILSVFIIIGLFWYINKQSKVELSFHKQISELAQQYRNTLDDNTYLSNQYNKYKEQVKILSNPDVQTIFLYKSDSTLNKIAAIICRNKKDKTVSILIKELPSPPKGKSYYLWSLKSSKYINLGSIHYSKAHHDFIIQKENTKPTYTYFITVEKEKTSSPNLSFVSAVEQNKPPIEPPPLIY